MSSARFARHPTHWRPPRPATSTPRSSISISATAWSTKWPKSWCGATCRSSLSPATTPKASTVGFAKSRSCRNPWSGKCCKSCLPKEQAAPWSAWRGMTIASAPESRSVGSRRVFGRLLQYAHHRRDRQVVGGGLDGDELRPQAENLLCRRGVLRHAIVAVVEPRMHKTLAAEILHDRQQPRVFMHRLKPGRLHRVLSAGRNIRVRRRRGVLTLDFHQRAQEFENAIGGTRHDGEHGGAEIEGQRVGLRPGELVLVPILTTYYLFIGIERLDRHIQVSQTSLKLHDFSWQRGGGLTAQNTVEAETRISGCGGFAGWVALVCVRTT